ncbi:MAG: ABC transporter permease, partial [Oscillospiraceae bacterium]
NSSIRMHPELLVTDDLGLTFADPNNDWQTAIDADGNPLVNPLEDKLQLTFDYSNFSGEQKADTDGRVLPGGKFYKLNITGECSTLNNSFTTAAFLDKERLQEWLDANVNFVGKKSKEELAQEKLTGTNYTLVWVKVKNVNDVQNIAKTIRNAGLSTYSLNDMLETVRNQSKQIQGMLGAIGAVAVFVSALCVANTMMISINERTREVGVLK